MALTSFSTPERDYVTFGCIMDSKKINKALFVNVHPLYVTDMRYLKEYPGSERLVQW